MSNPSVKLPFSLKKEDDLKTLDPEVDQAIPDPDVDEQEAVPPANPTPDPKEVITELTQTIIKRVTAMQDLQHRDKILAKYKGAIELLNQ